MENTNAIFTIKVDTRDTPFTQDDIYELIHSCIRQVPGWENAIENGKIQVYAAPTLGADFIAIITLVITVEGIAYTIVQDYFKHREDAARKKTELRMKQNEIKLLTKISSQLDSLQTNLEKYGEATIEHDEKK